MVYDYVVTLANRNKRTIDNISALVLILSLAFFIGQLFRRSNTSVDLNKTIGWGWDITNSVWWDNKLLLFGTPLLLLLVGITFYQAMIKHRNVAFSRCLLIAGVVWLFFPPLFWIAFPLIGLGLLEKFAKNDLEVGFSPKEVVINSLIKRRFAWSEFNNIMLKDDLLTMDFKNNKLIQRMTIDEEADADEDEFNAYCTRYLSAIS